MESLPAVTAVGVGRAPDWERGARRARLLAWTSLAWLGFEGVATVLAGAVAGLIVVWRFTGPRMLSDTSERRAQKLVAASFFLLAPYVAVEAIRTLAVQH